MPTTTTKHAPGTFVWPELATTDQAAAKRFYSTLFGWKTSDTPMGQDQPPYTIFTHKEQQCAALYRMMPEQVQQGVPPHWGAYISVDDCDAAAERVKAAGGKVLMGPMDVMKTYGRMAMCSDPQGATFNLWQGRDHKGIGIMDEPGSLCWTELMTSDTAKAGEFYKKVIGWSTQAMPMEKMEYTCFQRPGGANAGGMMAITPEMGPVPPNWMTYFQVSDIQATVKKVAEMGGKVEVPPTSIPDIGQFAVLQDPQGAYFSVMQAA